MKSDAAGGKRQRVNRPWHAEDRSICTVRGQIALLEPFGEEVGKKLAEHAQILYSNKNAVKKTCEENDAFFTFVHSY